jgi:hypothetical protein
MNAFYRKATFADALQVGLNLREEDRREIEGLGHSPLILPACVQTSRESVAFFDSDGTIAGVGGISPDPSNGDYGLIWMLCTPVIANKPHTFVREARRWLSEHESKYKLLWNLADARNHYHHKLLRMLGFKALRVVNTRPYFLPYLEIVKLCA